jgi:hypothetical protein
MTHRTWSGSSAGHAGGVGGADVDTEFVELLSADTELLRMEFDAIIAQNFPRPAGRPRNRPPGRPGPPTQNRRRRIVLPGRDQPPRCGHQPERVLRAVDGRARQRSPPELRPSVPPFTICLTTT